MVLRVKWAGALGLSARVDEKVVVFYGWIFVVFGGFFCI